MRTKAIVCDDTAAWDARDAVAREGLSIPNADANCYATPSEVVNPESADIGKLVFPVKTFGKWKCDQFFDAADIVDWDFSWFQTPIILETTTILVATAAKAQLFNDISTWEMVKDFIESHFGIDSSEEVVYAAPRQVTNMADNVNFGKYVLPIAMEGEWTCDPWFFQTPGPHNATPVVDWEPYWFLS